MANVRISDLPPATTPLGGDELVEVTQGGRSRSITTSDLSGGGGSIPDGSITTAKLADDAVTNPKLRNSAAVSVIGRAANTTGDPADITAAADDFLLRRTGGALSFGLLTAGMFPAGVVATAALADNAVTFAKLANLSVSTGKLIDLAVSEAKLGSVSVSTGKIVNNAVDNGKLADMIDGRVKGRAAGSGIGDPVDLTEAQLTEIVNVFTSLLKGSVPASGGGTVNFLRADGSWVSPGTALSFGIQWTLDPGANGEFVVDQSATFEYTIDDAVFQTESGTITADVRINGVSVTGLSALSLSSTEGSATATGANTVFPGDKVTIVTTNNAAAVKASVKLNCTRT